MDIRNILLPTTNAGVGLQLVGVVAVGVVAMIWLRHNSDARLVAVGATLCALGLIGVRALH